MDNEEEGIGAAIDNEEPVHIRLKQFFAEKFDNCTNAFQKTLTPLQQGVAYALIILFLAQSISLLLNYTFILTILYNLLNLFATIFCIFSLFTWLNLFAGHHLNMNETHVYLLFLTCFISEFFIQFFTFNFKSILYGSMSNRTFVQGQSSANLASASPSFELIIETFYQVIIISMTCLFTFFYSNIKPSQYVYFLLFICITRFYATIYLSHLIPLHVCSYLTYLSALSGVLFSKYIEANFSFAISLNHNRNNVLMTRKNSLNKSQLKSSRASYFCSRCSLFSKSTHFFNNNVTNFSGKGSAEKRRKLTSCSVVSNSNSIFNFKRRSSLPTIPSKNEKVIFIFTFYMGA